MNGAADDLDAQGLVAKLFDPIPNPPGSVPQLRLLAALHHLVLAGRTPELAAYYPSVGGKQRGDGVWQAAHGAIEAHFDWIQQRLTRTVQTNEPGRSAVLYPALLWLTLEYELPIRLLEIGASAGLNLLVDRYCYAVNGREHGDPSSPVRFPEPWQPGPPIDAAATSERLQITSRAGCDRQPLDPCDTEDRITILSYIWPDELHRFERISAALEIASADPPPVSAEAASDWLARALSEGRATELTVVWQSVFRQYVKPDEWEEIQTVIEEAIADDRGTRTVWLAMEPGEDHLSHMSLSLRARSDEPEQLLARCGDHGPPVVWLASRG